MNYKLVLLKDGRNILVSDEEDMLKGELYYSTLHNNIFTCIHNQQQFDNTREFKIIAGINSLS